MRKILLFLISFAIVAMLDISTTFAQRADQNQKQRADNGKPYTVAIHRLNDKALNDSLLIETEDTTNFFSRRTSVGQLKSYINSSNSSNLSIQFFSDFQSDSLAPSASYSGPQKYDDDGDSIKITLEYSNSQNFIFYLKKPNGTASNLASYTLVTPVISRATSAQLMFTSSGLTCYSGVSAFYNMQSSFGLVMFYGPTTPLAGSSAEPAWDGTIYVQLDINK